MSFEGYYQILCCNGHYSEIDCYLNPTFDPSHNNVWRCPDCDELAVWWNLVDETNGSYCDECNPECKDNVEGCEWCVKGRIDGRIDLEVDRPREMFTCKECGCSKIISLETYKVPKSGGCFVNK